MTRDGTVCVAGKRGRATLVYDESPENMVKCRKVQDAYRTRREAWLDHPEVMLEVTRTGASLGGVKAAMAADLEDVWEDAARRYGYRGPRIEQA